MIRKAPLTQTFHRGRTNDFNQMSSSTGFPIRENIDPDSNAIEESDRQAHSTTHSRVQPDPAAT
jgi:hypothetical protein